MQISLVKTNFHLSVIGILLIFNSCGSHTNLNPPTEKAGETFQSLLEEAIADSHGYVSGVSMTVICPELGINWKGASGFANKEETRDLAVNQPFRIASITKTFVGASILRLHEMGRLSLDDSIGQYISETHQKLLTDAGYELNKITLRQCLHHTSGLFDYAMSGRTYLEMVIANPKRRWTRTEQIELAMQKGKPLGKPGEVYGYSDTGYILAGEIIENLMDTTLSYGMRKLLKLDSLNIASTWLETLENKPDNLPKVVNRYFSKYDATNWDASIDLYGGGGYVSTTADLTQFTQALFNHEVFQKQETLELMLSFPQYGENYNPKENPNHKDYRLGLWKSTVFGEEVYMHGGLWGTAMAYIPAYNCSISINCTNGNWDRLLKKTVLVIKNQYKSKL